MALASGSRLSNTPEQRYLGMEIMRQLTIREGVYSFVASFTIRTAA